MLGIGSIVYVRDSTVWLEKRCELGSKRRGRLLNVSMSTREAIQ